MTITGAVYYWESSFHDGLGIFVVGLVSKLLLQSYIACRNVISLCNSVNLCSANAGQLWHDDCCRILFAVARIRGGSFASLVIYCYLLAMAIVLNAQT